MRLCANGGAPTNLHQSQSLSNCVRSHCVQISHTQEILIPSCPLPETDVLLHSLLTQRAITLCPLLETEVFCIRSWLGGQLLSLPSARDGSAFAFAPDSAGNCSHLNNLTLVQHRRSLLTSRIRGVCIGRTLTSDCTALLDAESAYDCRVCSSS